MEENPPTQDSQPAAGRGLPRTRTPRATFSTPQPQQPRTKPAERTPRRSAKAAPPVTFQPPRDEDNPDTAGRPESNRAQPPRPAQTSAQQPSVPEHPTQDAPAKATTRKAAGSRRSGLAARTEVTSAKAFPGQAPPAEQVPAPPRKAARKAAKATATKATATKATAGPAPQTLPLTEHTAPDTTSADVIPPGQPTTTTPKPTESARPAPEAAPSVPAPRPATYSWAKVAGDPGHAPELLALAAIETIGPRAAEWARGVREAYPSATSHGVARLAVAQFTRRGWVTSALAAAAGTYAPMALAGAAAWTQAELVLHLAAAYGNDPADPARAAELLVLGRVHPSLADAEAALSAVTTGTPPQRGSAGQDAVWRLGRPLATRVGGWLALRAASRFFPGTSLLVAMLTSHGAAENLSVRATAFYRIA